MDEVGVFEARNSFSSLLSRVEKGEEITITRNGKPIAKLVSAERGHDVERAREAGRRILALRDSLPKDTLKGLSIKQLIDEGRRF